MAFTSLLSLLRSRREREARSQERSDLVLGRLELNEYLKETKGMKEWEEAYTAGTHLPGRVLGETPTESVFALSRPV